MAFTKSALDANVATLKAKVQECDQLNYNPGLAWSAVGGLHRIVHDFAERLRTMYISLIRT